MKRCAKGKVGRSQSHFFSPLGRALDIKPRNEIAMEMMKR
jgi:hypothetical protein